MKQPMMSLEEVEDFFALGLAIDAEIVPDEVWTRALVEARAQESVCFSSMGTAELYWTRASGTPHSRESAFILPPGQTAYETPHDSWMDDRDSDRWLWEPHRREQDHRLLNNIPDARAAEAIAECMRVHAELDAKFARGKDKEPPAFATVEEAVRTTMKRIESFEWGTLWCGPLRNGLFRALVAIAWSRPFTPVDVATFWRTKPKY